MSSKLILLTGATGGMGRELARQFAEMGYSLILAVRNIERGENLARTLRNSNTDIRVAKLDLSSPDSIRVLFKTLVDRGERLDGIINNAGIMNRYYKLSGFRVENTMAVNVLGTAMLTEGLLPILNPGAHIVFTTSLTRRFYRPRQLHIAVTEKEFSQLGTYGRSKAAISLYACYLQERHPEFVVNCADPGIVDTGMISMHRWYDKLADKLFRPIIRSARKGAQAAIKAFRLEKGCFVAYAGGSTSRLKYDADDADTQRLIAEIETKQNPAS